MTYYSVVKLFLNFAQGKVVKVTKCPFRRKCRIVTAPIFIISVGTGGCDYYNLHCHTDFFSVPATLKDFSYLSKLSLKSWYSVDEILWTCSSYEFHMWCIYIPYRFLANSICISYEIRIEILDIFTKCSYEFHVYSAYDIHTNFVCSRQERFIKVNRVLVATIRINFVPKITWNVYEIHMKHISIYSPLDVLTT